MAVGQICYHIMEMGNENNSIGVTQIDYPRNINIYDDIFTQEAVAHLNNRTITKLSVTAQPGTKIIINSDKEIMIGRSGVYEVEDVEITSLYFKKTYKMEINDGKSNKSLKDGYKSIYDAITVLQGLGLTDPGESDYAVTHKDDIKQNINTILQQGNNIVAGCNEFNTGYNGIYKTTSEVLELNNVIIDYVYE